MRVWLVEDKNAEAAGSLEVLVRQLENCSQKGLQLLGASPFQPDFAAAMRKLVPDILEVLLIDQRSWPPDRWSPELLDLGVGVVVVTAADRLEPLLPLADTCPVWFVPRDVGAEGLWLALVAAQLGQRRQAQLAEQVTRLQQRLNDRIVIERAKGILVQRLGISEAEAYQRLRVLSRRQRRQIRDIAQSLLDTQGLLLPDSNGFHPHPAEAEVPEQL